MLGLADIDLNVLRLRALTDDHAAVNLLAGSDEQCAAGLGLEETVGYRLTGLEGNEGALVTVAQLTLVLAVAVKLCIQDTVSLGIGHELAAVADETSGRDLKLETGIAAGQRAHAVQHALSLGQLLDHRAGALVRYVNVGDLHGLLLSALLIGLVDNLCLGNRELEALAAHGLHQYGKVQLTAAGNLEAVCSSSLLHAKRHVGVQLAEQTVADVTGGHKLTLCTGQRRIVDHEVHGDGGLGNLLEGDGCRVLLGADGITHMQILDTGYGNDGAVLGLLYIHSLQAVKLIELCDSDLLPLAGIMMVHHQSLLVHADGAVLHLADTDTAHELIVVNGGHQHLCGGLRITLRCRDVVQNRIKKRLHVYIRILHLVLGKAGLGGSEKEGAVQLLIGSVEVHHELQHLIHNLLRSRLGLVDLVDDHQHRQTQIQGTLQHEACLGHGTLEGIHQKDGTVYHLQDTLHLAAEVRMARGIHDIDLDALVADGRVLGQNGNASLPLNGVGVHDTDAHLLVVAEGAGLLQKLVHQCGFAMVNVGNDGYVTNVFSLFDHLFILIYFDSLYPLGEKSYRLYHRAFSIARVTLPSERACTCF